jgi:beta-1,4-N-acetylglucosaminyltransferase
MSASRRRGGAAAPRSGSSFAFVTVGTTLFDALVRAVDSEAFADALRVHGIDKVRIQLGRGNYIPGAGDVGDASSSLRGASKSGAAATGDAAAARLAAALASQETVTVPLHGITYEMYRLKPSLADDIAGATLVVSHAGAGSIFETLRARVPLVVVVNTALADNHQVELAEAMAERRHILVHCEPGGLAAAVRGADLSAATPLPPADGNLRRFTAALDGVMGFD